MLGSPSRSRALLARAEAVMAGGAPAGHRLAPEVDFVAARGSGTRVWDPNGREYLDLVLGSGPLLLGHAHPRVVEAVRRQVELGTTFYMTTEPAVELAEQVIGAAGGSGWVKYCSTGGEATAHAIRLARAFTGRPKIVKFEGGYHGGQDVTLLSVTPATAGGSRAQPDSAGITEGVSRDVLVAPFNDLETTAALLAKHAAEVAAVIVEPVQRFIRPHPEFLPGLRRLTEEHGALLIFDEVVTGFRIAYGGARELYGVQPDLAAYAKVLGGGLPLAAIWGREEVMAASDPWRRGAGRVQIRGTLSGNPLSCAAGLATLEVLREPGVYEQLRAKGRRLREGLVQAGRRAGVALQVDGEGPMAGVAFVDRPLSSYAEIAASDAERLRRVNREMIRRGVLVNLDAKLYLSLLHTDEEIDRVVEVFQETLAATA